MTSPGEMGLSGRVAALLADAAHAYAGTPEHTRLLAAQTQLHAPLRVALAGRIKAGKSTLLNALVGERLAATDAGECTRVVTEYSDGPASRAWAHPRTGEPVQIPFRRVGGATVLDLGSYAPADLDRLRVEVPNAQLHGLTLVDTPGIASLSSDVSARSAEFVTGGGVDAVLYLMRHLHSSDVNFLDAFADENFRGTSPVTALGVLSRADEIGTGRGDALASAADIAQRYRREPRVRGLVSTVVPVAGLLGEGAAALRESDYAVVAAHARQPVSELMGLLVSADRFVGDTACDVPVGDRRRVLDLLGWYGTRLSIALAQSGRVGSAAELARELAERSGLPELRALLRTAFFQRRDLLKAQSALREMTATLALRPVPKSESLRRRVEQVVASAHELVELRLLNDLRVAGLSTPDAPVLDDAHDALARLLGATGAAPEMRLSLPADSTVDVIRDAASAALRAWSRRAESPASPPDVRRAAAVARRTCEGILAGLPGPQVSKPRIRTFG